MKGKDVVVSVVRDMDMYKRCVGENPNMDALEKIVFDNNEENKYISVRYNEFLDDLDPDRDCWIVFCHEDWRADENMSSVLEKLDPHYIYGPIGLFLQRRLLCDYFITVGTIKQCDKSGKDYVIYNPKLLSGRVDTLDCQCMIVHASLIRKHSLRFDENLPFDMYVEDFCAFAHEKYGIETNVCPIECTHFSHGNLSDNFYRALAYVNDKFRGSYKRYISTVGYRSTFGGSDRSVHHTRVPRLAMKLNGILIKKNR